MRSASLGAWGTYRLLGRLALDPAERFALTLALFPAMLGLAAFAGLLAGRPGPLLPSVLCVALAALGWARRHAGEAPHPPDPLPRARERGSRIPWSQVCDCNPVCWQR